MNSFFELVQKRYSCRNYSDKKVEKEKILSCLDAARLAPSACNKQPCRFIIVSDDQIRRNICAQGLLPGINMSWLEKAPIIAVLCVETSLLPHQIAPLVSGINYHYVDAGIAGEHFVLQAEELGLGTCWIGWFNEKSVKRILKIPKHIKAVSLIALGYSEQNIEIQQKDRKQITDISHNNLWGKKFS